MLAVWIKTRNFEAVKHNGNYEEGTIFLTIQT